MFKIFALALAAVCILAQCPKDERCLDCNNTTCGQCYMSYPNATGVCTVGTTVNNCYSYSANGTCSVCNYGYYLNNGACTEITVDKCAVVDNTAPTTCIACENSILAANGVCTGTTKCTATNCEICNAANQCLACTSNYSLTTTFTCVAAPVKGCMNVAQDGTTCDKCRPGYYHNGTSCLSSAVSTAMIINIVSLVAVMVFTWF